MRLHRTEQPERFCSGCLLHLGLTYIPRCALRDFRSERTSRTSGTGESDLNLLKWLNRYFTKTEKLLWACIQAVFESLILMMRLKAASMVSVRLFGTAQAKKRVVSRMNGKRIDVYKRQVLSPITVNTRLISSNMIIHCI